MLKTPEDVSGRRFDVAETCGGRSAVLSLWRGGRVTFIRGYAKQAYATDALALFQSRQSKLIAGDSRMTRFPERDQLRHANMRVRLARKLTPVIAAVEARANHLNPR